MALTKINFAEVKAAHNRWSEMSFSQKTLMGTEAADIAELCTNSLDILLPIVEAARRLVDIDLHEHENLAVDELYNELVAALKALE